MRDDLEKLLDIQEAIEKIDKYYDENKLILDELLQAAIIRYLEIIGEACRTLTEEMKKKSPETEWAKIIAFRNYIAHNYFDLDWNIVNKIIKEDIPILKIQINNIVENYNK